MILEDQRSTLSSDSLGGVKSRSFSISKTNQPSDGVSSEWIDLRDIYRKPLGFCPRIKRGISMDFLYVFQSYPIKFWESKATSTMEHPFTSPATRCKPGIPYQSTAPHRSGPLESGPQPLPAVASTVVVHFMTANLSDRCHPMMS